MGVAQGKRQLFAELRQKFGSTATPKEPTIAFRATPKQQEWFRAWRTGLYKFMAIGGGIRGTKTIACLALFVMLCRIYPRSRWAVVRKDLPTIRRNVLPSMEKIRMWAGGFVGELNQSNWTYTCANGSQILLFAEQFSQDPELERFKGLEVNGFDAEECSEMNEKTANKMIERAGSYIIPATVEDPTPRQPPPLILFNFNPCANWPRKWFYLPWKAGTLKPPFYFLPATIADNPFASEDYLESLKHLPPEEYKRFVMGEWDFVDDPDQLIKAEWIWAARDVEPVGYTEQLGVDVARYGDDYSTIARIRGNALKAIAEQKGLSTDRVGDWVLNESAGIGGLPPVDAYHVKIDGVGLGAGTVDYVRRKKRPVVDFISGAAPIPRMLPDKNGKTGSRPAWLTWDPSVFKFKNLRSQAWWEFREKMRLGLLSIDLTDKKGNPIPTPEKLVADLAAPRYTISGDKVIEVESKDDIKLRLGRSTDYGDAWVMAEFEFPEEYVRSQKGQSPSDFKMVRS